MPAELDERFGTYIRPPIVPGPALPGRCRKADLCRSASSQWLLSARVAIRGCRPAAVAPDRSLWVRLSPHCWVCQESGCLVANIGIRRPPSKPFPPALGCDILVSMTRKAPSLAVPTAQPRRSRWRLQDAKARFSELVRMAHSDGPQHVTLHGRDAVVVVDADEFNRLQGARTGELLIEALQASPHRQIEIEPRRSAMPVRAVKL